MPVNRNPRDFDDYQSIARTYVYCFTYGKIKVPFKCIVTNALRALKLCYVSDNCSFSGSDRCTLIVIYFSTKEKVLSSIVCSTRFRQDTRVSLPYEYTKLRYVTQFHGAREKSHTHKGVCEAKNKYLSHNMCFSHFHSWTMQFISQN